MDENKIIELYESGKSSYEVSELVGISPTQVRRILSKFSIRARSTKTCSEIENKIISFYKDGYSAEKIGEEFKMSGTTVCRILKRNGIDLRNRSESRRKYKINESFMDDIDTEEKAYILGFMYADGNVSSSTSTISLILHKKDIDILKKISLIFYGIENIQSKENSPYVRFGISNKHLKETFIKHGCVPNKTFKITMPSLRKDLVRHFLRGLYDGDGCISVASNNIRVILTGSTSFLEEIKTVIENVIGITPYIYYTKKKNNVSDLCITDRGNCIKFLNFIYNNSTIYLERKFENYKKATLICNQAQKHESENIISYNSNKLTSGFISSLPVEEREVIALFLFDYFRQNGFPYQKYYDSEMIEDFNKLINFESCKLNSENINNFPECGLKVFKNFCPHFYEVSGGKLPSMIDAFNDDKLLINVIRNRLGITYKETFNITGNMIRQGIRNSYNGFAASTFKPSLAKTIYDNFAPDNSVVLDISTGFGQRMLGAMASKKVKKYIGLDPWNKQIKALSSMSRFLGFEEKVELYEIGSEKFCPDTLIGTIDFCFSSPPFFDKEIYTKDESQAYYGKKNIYDFFEQWWCQTYKNVYAILKKESLFIINMDKKMSDIMISMCKNNFKLIDTISIIYKRSHMPKNSTDCFFVLKSY